MEGSPAIVAPTARIANQGRLEHLLSRLGSDTDQIGALQMLSATAATTAPPPQLPARNVRKRAAEPSMDREGSSSNGGLQSDTMLPQDETTLQRAKKMQEKNKRAQARYRQRQRVRQPLLQLSILRAVRSAQPVMALPTMWSYGLPRRYLYGPSG